MLFYLFSSLNGELQREMLNLSIKYNQSIRHLRASKNYINKNRKRIMMTKTLMNLV